MPVCEGVDMNPRKGNRERGADNPDKGVVDQVARVLSSIAPYDHSYTD
jgi:hypothetical protein